MIILTKPLKSAYLHCFVMFMKLSTQHLQLGSSQDGTTEFELDLVSLLDQKTLPLLQLLLLCPVFLHLPRIHKTHTNVILCTA